MKTSLYPTRQQLSKIRNWNGNFKGLWEYICSLWAYPKFGIVEDFSSDIYKLELHTAGWGGNEDIIRAFAGNILFSMYHSKWEKGGHYYFETPCRLWEYSPTENLKNIKGKIGRMN